MVWIADFRTPIAEWFGDRFAQLFNRRLRRRGWDLQFAICNSQMDGRPRKRPALDWAIGNRNGNS
jgi:hypothetical protein